MTKKKYCKKQKFFNVGGRLQPLRTPLCRDL
uniref:Uncharacterized protein n=1 Tax=Lepeophtheirus salmonis TaxID=72036 RepID=A0A0K2UJV6_LEPSM